MREYAIALLRGEPGVSALAGTRVYWLRAPGGTARPYVVLTAIRGPRDFHSRGAVGLRRDRVQVDTYADDMATAEAVRAAVEDLLHMHKGSGAGVEVQGVFADGGRDLTEKTEGGEVHLVRLSDDYFFYWQAE